MSGTGEGAAATGHPCDSIRVTRACQDACGPCWDIGGCARHDIVKHNARSYLTLDMASPRSRRLRFVQAFRRSSR